MRLIVAQGAASLPVVRATRTVPVVYGYSGDPVVAGIAQSLARPGGTATGVTFMAIELNPKRIDFARALLPNCRRMALLSNARHAGEEREIEACRKAVAGAGVELSVHRLQAPAEIVGALTAALDAGAEAVVALPSALMVLHAPSIVATCAVRRVPVVSGWAQIARAGAVLTYGPRLAESYRRIAHYVVRILDGAVPGDLPVEQPSVFELIVNLRAARELGLTVPPGLLASADEVIE